MIYFDENKKAYAYEIENYIATVEDEVWAEFATTDKWDIIDGQFVDISETEEYKEKAEKEYIEQTLKGYEDAVQKYLDKTAQSKGYDNTYTCLSYLSSTDEIWNREANAFNAWRDSVWRKCHEILNGFMAGEIAQPTVEELIEQLPVIDWGD
jgi:hypothetical protein